MAAKDQTNFADGSELLSFSIDRGAPESIFRQLYGALRRLILDGIAPAGSRLPASRLVAERLGVSRASVVGVYEQLLAEGYLIGRQGAGTFVSSDMLEPLQRPPHRALARALAQASAPNRRPKPAARYAALAPDPAQFEAVPFNTGRCSLDEQTLATWRRLTAAALRRPDALWLGYGDPRGSPRLREALAHYLRASRGVQCDADQILILSGVQQAIDLVLKILIEPGDPVWIEDPTYPALHDALKAARARIVPVPVDGQGLVVAKGVAASPLARAVYVTPSHQSPSGVVLSMTRRLELLAWAREARAWIIEDDYDSEFRYAGRPIASLQGIDRGERVIYLGTFSKVVFPGLRLGYAVVPHELLQAMTAARHLTDRQAPAVTESVVADFIEQGHFEAHVRRMRATYRVARDQLAAALRARLGRVLEVEVPDQGMRLMARLAAGWSDRALAEQAAARGLVLRPMSKLYLSAPPLQALLLGFTGYSLPALRAGVDRLEDVVGRHAHRWERATPVAHS